MKEENVTFKIAELLHKKGFNEGCWGYYDLTKNNRLSECAYSQTDNSYAKEHLAAPIQSIAQKWLRETHGLIIEVKIDVVLNNGYGYHIRIKKEDSIDKGKYPNYKYDTYESALESAIEEALQMLPKLKMTAEEQRGWIYNYPTTYEEGFTSREIHNVIDFIKEPLDKDKFYDGLRGITCISREGEMVIYHTDVLNALRCGLDNRELNQKEWD